MIKNNKSRTLINIIGLPLFISSILLGGYYFGVFIFLVIILGTKEYLDLLNKHSINPSSRLLYFGQLILILLSLFYLGLDSMFGKAKIILPVIHLRIVRNGSNSGSFGKLRIKRAPVLITQIGAHQEIFLVRHLFQAIKPDQNLD